MVGIDPGPLRCPFCASKRFTRLSPPYGPLSVIRCAECRSNMALSDLTPRLLHERSNQPENRPSGA